MRPLPFLTVIILSVANLSFAHKEEVPAPFIKKAELKITSYNEHNVFAKTPKGDRLVIERKSIHNPRPDGRLRYYSVTKEAYLDITDQDLVVPN